jgi:uncharacterized membrane protein
MTLLVVANAASAWVMVGVIWFVQVVHYPLLSVVPVENAREVSGEHQSRTALVVMVPMAVEGVTTLWLMFDRPADVPWQLAWAGGVCVAVALLCTVLLSVPRHARMAENPDASVGRELVLTNWPRTVAWTFHGIISAVLLFHTV